MSKTKTVDIRLKEAQSKFTRLKKTSDGSAAYRKAKTELAYARQAYAEQRRVPSKPGDGQAKIKAVAATAKANTKEQI